MHQWSTERRDLHIGEMPHASQRKVSSVEIQCIGRDGRLGVKLHLHQFLPVAGHGARKS